MFGTSRVLTRCGAVSRTLVGFPVRRCILSRTIPASTLRQRYMSSSSTHSQPSVSQQEVAKFSDMHQTWWDSDNPLIAMNPVRVKYIVDMLQQQNCLLPGNEPPLEGLAALDVGCGGGLLSESLARLGANVTAIDPSVELVKAAQEHAQLDPRTQSIQFHGGTSVEDLASYESNKKYHVICILEVLEHVANVDSMLSAAASLLKAPTQEDPAGGMLFVSTMNRTIKSHAVTILGAEYVMGYLPVGTHQWELYQSPDEVQQRMKKVGLEPANVSGMVLSGLPICGTWKWKLDPNDTDVNWIGAYKHSSKADSKARA